jgi:thiol-disulfide isomerase/thioredoxin
MNAYVKGGVVCAALIIAALVWFYRNESKLAVRKTPDHYSLIDKMEKSGVPEFSASRLDGSTYSLSEAKGKIVILNFWASWCNPCVQEFPSLIKLIDKFEGKVVLVALSADEDKKDVEAFLKAFGLPKPNIEILWDKDRTIANRFGVGKIPESFLVGKDGKLLRKIIGIDDWATPGAIEFFTDLVNGVDSNAK